jgi:hypothetical protein
MASEKQTAAGAQGPIALTNEELGKPAAQEAPTPRMVWVIHTPVKDENTGRWIHYITNKTEGEKFQMSEEYLEQHLALGTIKKAGDK